MKKRFSCVLKLELGAGVGTRSLSAGQLSGVKPVGIVHDKPWLRICY